MTQPNPIPHSGPPSISVVETEESVLARTFILHVKSRGSFETAVKIGAFISNRQGAETVDVKETTVTLDKLEYGVTYRVNITATSVDCPEAGASSVVVPVALEARKSH